MEAALPKVRWGGPVGEQVRLTGRPLARAERAARDALLERLQRGGEVSAAWLVHQQVDVLGHDHVADDDETVTPARGFETAQEQIAATGRAEQRLAAITAERYEVKMSVAV